MRRKNFLGVSLHFLALKAQLVVLVSAFVMVSTVGEFLVSCFSTDGAHAQPFVKVGDTCPAFPIESASLVTRRAYLLHRLGCE